MVNVQYKFCEVVKFFKLSMMSAMIFTAAGILTLVALSAGYSNDVASVVHFQQSVNDYPFRNTSFTWKQRVDDLVSRLTLDEITQQMARGGRTTYAPAIERLGIKPYSWGTECLRGDVDAGPATAFPQALGLSAMFSTEDVYRMAQATGVEVRAKYNNYTSHGIYNQYHGGLSCWSPVINIVRDPRWGRNQETYGEDPFLSGQLAKAYVKGLQGDDKRYVQANAGCKHFAAYAGPEDTSPGRFKFDAKVLERDLRMTFFPQFKDCADAGAWSFMCSYNSVNGIPACANKHILKDVLRSEWGFNGYVISDEGAIEQIEAGHGYTKNATQTAAVAVNGGTNLEDGPGGVPYMAQISEAVKEGMLSESLVREYAKPLFEVRMRLGEFDPPAMNPYTKFGIDLVQNAEHRNLSEELAMKSFVLLKNSNSYLPLDASKKFKKLAIVGPMADSMNNIIGDYAPDSNIEYQVTPRKGLQNVATDYSFAEGCQNSDPKCLTYDTDSIKKAVGGADIIVVCLGTGSAEEAEGHDKQDINLPGKQLQLLQDTVSAAMGTPVILLLFNAGPLDVSWAHSSTGVAAIIECFFPAQAAGTAIRKMLFNDGAYANPAGRLPVTWVKTLNQFPAITNYSMDGRTYRYTDGNVFYPFGYGLSYSKFSYVDLHVSPTSVGLSGNDTINVTVTLENLSKYSGDEVVQVYVSWTNSRKSVGFRLPNLQLVAFSRVTVPANKHVQVTMSFKTSVLNVWFDNAGFKLLPDDFKLYVGGQQPKQVVTTGSNILSTTFTAK